MFRFALVCVCALLLVSGAVGAGPPSLLEIGTQRVALVDLDRNNPGVLPGRAATERPKVASLFAGREGNSLFARRALRNSGIGGLRHAGVTGLRHLIASAEAGAAGYDAVQHGARIRPSKPPTQLTIRDIRQWIKATPGQPHAIGRYQLIPATFRRLVKQIGLQENTVFSPGVQDQFADALLEEAGLSKYLNGELGKVSFMNNLAKIWAGLPNHTGKSHYDGYAGNKSVISWDHFEREMDRMFRTGRT